MIPPFNGKVEREEYPNDGSKTTRWTITAFYRSIKISYSRPMWKRWRDEEWAWR